MKASVYKNRSPLRLSLVQLLHSRFQNPLGLQTGLGGAQSPGSLSGPHAMSKVFGGGL